MSCEYLCDSRLQSIVKRRLVAGRPYNQVTAPRVLPSAPEKPIVVREEVNRPQPRFDRNAGNGMSVVVGRIRKDPVMTLRYTCLGHNTIRGAAGAAILSAELMTAKGYV